MPPKALKHARIWPVNYYFEQELFVKKTFVSTVSLVFCLLSAASQASGFIVLQSTTSTQSSGLYDHLLPIFEQQSGLEVRVVAVGTGQAIKNAKNCDGDVLWVHATDAEEAFVAQGYADSRSDVMYNDFVLIGPAADPAAIKGDDDVLQALQKIARSGAAFASRGDDSGTHKKELKLWVEAGIDPQIDSGGWYRETGSGMGATLNVGTGMGAYVLTDRATWINFGNKGSNMILLQGDGRLFNQYGIMQLSERACDNIKVEPAKSFVDWVLGEVGQAAIAEFELDGQQLFFPNASN